VIETIDIGARVRRAGVLAFVALVLPAAPRAQTADDTRLIDAATVLQALTAAEDNAIPVDVLEQARGIAVVPEVLRGGFILGARRGRGVLVTRTADGAWSNPAFIILTGGSFGWQIGAESTDLVLVFANDNAVKNMRNGKFTLGGDATAVAGPLGRHATAAVTFRAEVYGYVRSRGLFAGAAFEGARLAIDAATNARFYPRDRSARELERVAPDTPESAQRFLRVVERSATAPAPGGGASPDRDDEAVTFPLE
jgi:lipid-binding SYLF domain-containing protein